MDNHLHLPARISPYLRQLAFQVGYMIWPAWSLADGLLAIEEMRSFSLAVLGGNLVTQTADGDTQTYYTTEAGEYVSTFDIERETHESWYDFVDRSCDEAVEVLRSFKPTYPVSDPEPCVLGFMLLWEMETNSAC